MRHLILIALLFAGSAHAETVYLICNKNLFIVDTESQTILTKGKTLEYEMIADTMARIESNNIVMFIDTIRFSRPTNYATKREGVEGYPTVLNCEKREPFF